ncbi:class I SAM-dependent methyltransferase [bacterium]|nr:class I SAM-dependent methyltransferase [bacterium]
MTSSNAPRIDRCRVCGNTEIIPCIDIGEQYLSSVFPENLEYRRDAVKYPLDMVMCKKKEDGSTCGLVQLGHRLDLTAMYDAYPYTSSTNSSMARILEDVAASAKTLNALKEGDVVLDIGGNDGTLLSFFREDPVRLITIDPAKNVTPMFSSERYTVVRDFFNKAAFDAVSAQKAKLVFSIAMFYHLDDPISLARDVAACLDDDGVWIIQMAYLPAMIRTNMYDNIVHEHAGYYATNHMTWLLDQVGLEVFDVTENDVYGGSFRVFVKKKGCAAYPTTERLNANLRQEIADGLFEEETYHAFMRRIEKTRDDLRQLCNQIKAEGKSIWVYGASTKGNTILQYCGIGGETITAAADSNPFKHWKYIIGSDIRITTEEEMREAKPDYLIALPYSFVDGFMKRESALVSQGTKFIVPLPDVKVIGN